MPPSPFSLGIGLEKMGKWSNEKFKMNTEGKLKKADRMRGQKDSE
jgi:hypothetical protein